MLTIDKCCLVVVDVQGKLAESMVDKEALFKNIEILIKSFTSLGIPIIWCQQRPEALGPTVPSIQTLLSQQNPVNKISFSCVANKAFHRQLIDLGRPQVVLCGIEAHVCIYQTALALLDNYHVEVVADAVSSRSEHNRRIALERMQMERVGITSVEMLLFELLGRADHPLFREIARLIK